MRISEAKFTRRYNVGQYEHEEYSLVAVLEDGTTSAVAALAKLKADVAAAYGGETGAEIEAEVVAEQEDPKLKKKKAKKSEPEESVSEESSEEETGDEDMAEEDSATEEESAEEDDAPKAAKKFKKKAQTYSRENETHKEIFSDVLKAVAPDWKKTPESKARGKTVSATMEGEDFLDADGEVLAGFKAAVKKLMRSKK